MRDNVIDGVKWMVAFLLVKWQEITIPSGFTCLLVAQGIDIVSGFLAAKNTRSLCGEKMSAGLRRKILTWCAVAACSLTEWALGIEHRSGPTLAVIGMIAFTMAEVLSILRNVAKGGVQVDWLQKIVEKYFADTTDRAGVKVTGEKVTTEHVDVTITPQVGG